MEQCSLIQFKSFIQRIACDSRMRPTHISLSLALCQAWMQQGFQTRFQISRRMIMRSAHIRSIATYHKTIKELQAFGYLQYSPSFHPQNGSEVMLIHKHPIDTNAVQA